MEAKQMNVNKYDKKMSSAKVEMMRNLNKMKNSKLSVQNTRKCYTKRVVEMQMFSALPSIAGVASSAFLGFKTNRFLNKGEKAFDAIVPQLQQTLENFNNVFEKCSNTFFKAVNVIEFAVELISSLLQVTFAKASCKIASLIIEIIRLVRKYVNMKNLDFNLIKDLVFEPQVDCKSVEMQIDFESVDMKEYLAPSYIAGAIFVALSAVFTANLPNKSDMMSLFDKLGKLGRSAKGMDDLNTVLCKHITVVLDHFGVNVLKLKTDTELNALITGYNEWCEEVQALVGHKILSDGSFESQSIVDDIMKDCHKILHVEEMYKRGMEISRQIAEQRLPHKLSMGFNLHMRYLSDVFKAVDTSGAFGNKPRTQPVVIWLYGESGVGKSGMSWPLSIDLNNLLVEDIDEARNFSKNVYMRNVEQDFWDNYTGQNVVVYDDFGQMKDSEGRPNMEFMEIIRTANIAPYPLHMAHLEDKRKTKFTSKIILLTSNVFEQDVKSLTFADAFRRRIDLCGRVKCRDEFTKTCWSAAQGMNVKRLDRSKVQDMTGNLISTQVYLIDLINPENGEVIAGCENMTYDEFLEKSKELVNRCRVQSAGLNEYLMQYAAARKENPSWSSDKKLNFEKIEVRQPEVVAMQNLCELRAEQEGKMGKIYKKHLENKKKRGIFFQKREVDMQIDSLDRELEVVEPSQLYQILSSQGEKPILYTLDGDEVCYDALTFELAQLPIEDQLSYIRELHLCVKENKVKRCLTNVSNSQQGILKQWYEDSLKYVKEHPWQIFLGLFGALVGVLTMCKFWSYLMGTPNKQRNLVVPQDFINLGNVLIVPFNEEEKDVWNDIDNYYDLVKYNKNAQSDLVGKIELEVVKVRSVYPEFVEQLQKYNKLNNKTTIILSINDRVNLDRLYKLRISKVNSFRNLKKIEVEASVSADAVTLKQTHAKLVEANPSGDAITSKQSVARYVEAVSSGDNSTFAKQAVKHVEAFASADLVTARQATIKHVECVEVIEAEMQMWKDQVAQKLISNRVLANLYKICLVCDDGVKPLLNGLFVKSNIMLVPGHLLGFLSDNDVIEIRNLFDVTFRFPFKDVKVIDITNALGEVKEAALLQFPKFVCAHSDLVKHFSDAEAMSKYKRAEITLPTIRYSEKLGQLVTTLLESDKCIAHDTEIELHDLKKGVYVLRRGLEYKMPTIVGDCGAPVVINETQVLRKIAGIHVAGDKDGNAYAESITRGDLTRALKKIEVSMQISLDLDSVVDLGKSSVSLPVNKEITSEMLRDCCDLPALKFLPVGKIAQALFEPGKTELRPSLVYGDIDKIRTKPAYLTNRIVDGQVVNMKHKNLMKCAMDTPYIDENLLERAFLFTRQKWLQNMRPELKRILTFEEGIMGSDISEYTGPLNRSSSPGYPWILQREKGTKGKQGWFGMDEYVIDESVKAHVMKRIYLAEQGIRLPVLWVDTLKDERRPIEKVNTLKTRVFSNGPMDFSIAFRMYFLGFIAHLMENRIQNEVSIGTNVYSQDWAKTVRKLQQKGKKIIAGDFSTFDGSLNVCIMKYFAKMANEFYKDGNDLIREVLMDDVINSIHICGDSVYQWTHSQPSGNPATTPLNCFINSMGLRMCFERLSERFNVGMSMKDFDKHVSLVAYGDDNVINFSDAVCEWYNMTTITEAFAEFGFTYTDELKGAAGEVPKWRSIEDVQYLKRNFRYDVDRKVWEAPLAIETILEMPNWCRGTLDIHEGTKLNCENAIMELSMHPKDVFDFWSAKIQNAFVDATGEYLEVDTYIGYAKNRFFEYYSN